jgi:hypothetical protein
MITAVPMWRGSGLLRGGGCGVARRVGEADKHKATDLGIRNFRVATVTTTPERVEHMLESLKRITESRGSNIFLFTDEAALAACNPLDLEWMSGKGGLVRLID